MTRITKGSLVKFHEEIKIGMSPSSGRKIHYKAFGTADSRPDNFNMSIFGMSGSGMSNTMKLLLARETIGMGVHSRLIDIEGEFTQITKRLGGLNVTLTEDSAIRINPLAINLTSIEYDEDDEEIIYLENNDELEMIEKNGKKYIQFVPIREKINEVINFFDIIIRGKYKEEKGIYVFERNYTEEALRYLYTEDPRFLYTSHPSSLYEEIPKEKNGMIIQSKVRKHEPTLSDVFEYIMKHYSNEPKAERLLAALRPFLKGGRIPIFDGQTFFDSNSLVDINVTRIVNFDISHLESGFLRSIAYHVICNYVWEYFIKNPENEMKKKILYADGFWSVVDNDQTVSFFDKVARRSSKRNAGLRIASEDFVRILESKKARMLLRNSYTSFFFKQSKMDCKYIKENFDFTQEEINRLFQNPDKGEGILRVGKSSVWIQTDQYIQEV